MAITLSSMASHPFRALRDVFGMMLHKESSHTLLRTIFLEILSQKIFVNENKFLTVERKRTKIYI